MTKQPKILLNLLSGGYGSRLWPWSRISNPKQFIVMPHTQGKSMYQHTLLRHAGLALGKTQILCLKTHRHEARLQAKDVQVDIDLLLEPEGRGTAASVAMAALSLKDEEGVMVVAPVDHTIDNPQLYREILNQAATYALEHDQLVLLGVTPTVNSEAYGYISLEPSDSKSSNEEKPAIRKVSGFIEKPNSKDAQELIDQGALWNCGIFIGKPSTFLKELAQHAPDSMNKVQASFKLAKSIAEGQTLLDANSWGQIDDVPFDRAVVEKAQNVHAIAMNNWRDVGTFDSIKEYCLQADLGPEVSQDAQQNIMVGEVTQIDSKDNLLVSGPHRHLGVVGVQGLTVIDDGDAVLVVGKGKGNDVGKIAARIGQVNRSLTNESPKVTRPWGSYQSLVTTPEYRIKQLDITPGHGISIQRHKHRTEKWTVIRGQGKVLKGETWQILETLESITIPKTVIHSVRNETSDPLIIVEIQTGDYFGEDDIERFKDDYGRE